MPKLVPKHPAACSVKVCVARPPSYALSSHVGGAPTIHCSTAYPVRHVICRTTRVRAGGGGAAGLAAHGSAGGGGGGLWQAGGQEAPGRRDWVGVWTPGAGVHD